MCGCRLLYNFLASVLVHVRNWQIGPINFSAKIDSLLPRALVEMIFVQTCAIAKFIKLTNVGHSVIIYISSDI